MKTKRKKIRLICGCCGRAFETKGRFPDQDRGFGICPPCQKMEQDYERQQMNRMICLVHNNLSDENRQKFIAMTREKKENICMALLEEGVITFKIN